MTEPHAGSDPTLFTTQAIRDGGEWIINEWKFFSSNASSAAFLIVMAVTDPDASPYRGMSMFLVPSDTPGVNIGGGVIGLRDNHSVHILQKQPNGQWQIISEMFSDARQDLSYINHS